MKVTLFLLIGTLIGVSLTYLSMYANRADSLRSYLQDLHERDVEVKKGKKQ
jgi:hypothetical protein